MPDARVLAILTLSGLAIRLYLSATSFCISGDGMAFIWIAKDYGAGHAAKALAGVFPPAYPWLIAQMHRAIPDWEAAGNLVSTAAGTATPVNGGAGDNAFLVSAPGENFGSIAGHLTIKLQRRTQ